MTVVFWIIIIWKWARHLTFKSRNVQNGCKFDRSISEHFSIIVSLEPIIAMSLKLSLRAVWFFIHLYIPMGNHSLAGSGLDFDHQNNPFFRNVYQLNQNMCHNYIPWNWNLVSIFHLLILASENERFERCGIKFYSPVPHVQLTLGTHGNDPRVPPGPQKWNVCSYYQPCERI